MKESSTVHVRTFVRTRVPRVPYAAITSAILGPTYEISIVLAGATRAQDANKRTRGKDYVPNVLALPLSPHSGEVILTPAVAKEEAIDFGHTYPQHLTYLFIHACLHLQGMDHGAAMERAERKFLAQFSTRKD